MKSVFWTAALATVFTAVRAEAQQTRAITFAEAIQLATRQANEVLIARQGTIAAEEHKASTTAALLPSLRAEGNVILWPDEQEISLAPAGAPTSTIAAPGFVVRDQVTASLTLTIAEPLTGLYAIAKAIGLDNRMIEAAKADEAKAQLDAANRAGEAFLRILQARAAQEITEKTLSQVDAQLERARSLEKAGVLQAVDVLRLESLRAQTKQGLLQAQTGTTIAQRGLAFALSLRDGTTLDAKDDLPPEPPALTAQAAESITAALTGRPDLLAAKKRVEAAEFGRALAMSAYIPNISLVGTYQHNEGSLFQEKNSVFAGLVMQWNIFDWGRAWNSADEADARAEQARLGAELLGDAIAFEAEQRVLNARTAYETIAVLKSGLAAAEETHRIQTARYAQGEATTTDVLDAETDLARARTASANARYDYYLSLLALSRAVGELPSIGGGNK